MKKDLKRIQKEWGGGVKNFAMGFIKKGIQEK